MKRKGTVTHEGLQREGGAVKRDGHDRTVLGTAKGAGCEKGGRLVTLEGLQREGQPGTGILDKTPGPCAPRYAPRCGTRCARPSLYARVAPEQNIGRAAGSCTRGLPSARPAREESYCFTGAS